MKNSKSLYLRRMTGIVIIVMASFVLAACGNSSSQEGASSQASQSSQSSQATTEQSSSSQSTRVSGLNDSLDDHPATLAKFAADLETQGYVIVSGVDEDGNEISGATKEANYDCFFANVKIREYDAVVVFNYKSNTWWIKSTSMGISGSGFSGGLPASSMMKYQN